MRGVCSLQRNVWLFFIGIVAMCISGKNWKNKNKRRNDDLCRKCIMGKHWRFHNTPSRGGAPRQDVCKHYISFGCVSIHVAENKNKRTLLHPQLLWEQVLYYKSARVGEGGFWNTIRLLLCKCITWRCLVEVLLTFVCKWNRRTVEISRDFIEGEGPASSLHWINGEKSP